MKIRADIAELLQAGWSDKAIASHLHTHRSKVRAARHALRIPTHKPGPKPAASPEELFWRRAQPTDNGHLMWPGIDGGRGAHIGHQGRAHSVHRVAFRIRYQREPVGHVRTGCGTTGCVHPDHVEDQRMRDQYNALFGAAL